MLKLYDCYLDCARCKVRLPFPQADFIYTSAASPEETAATDHGSDEVWDLLVDPIWCQECDAPGFCERVPSLAEFEAAAAILKMRGAINLRAHGVPAEARIETDLIELGEQMGPQALRIVCARLANRRSSGACLVCGSRRTVRIELAADRAVRFNHEPCDGPLLFQESLSIGSNAGYSTEPSIVHYFDWNGQRLWTLRYTGRSPAGGREWELVPSPPEC